MEMVVSKRKTYFAVFPDGVHEGNENFRHWITTTNIQTVNLTCLKNGRRWRGNLPAEDVFETREAALAEWSRRYI
jgi:hypothetical protein